MTRKLKLLFILDPLEGLKAYKDSSVAMMRAAARRGHEVWALQRAGLTWREGVVIGTGCVALEVGDDDAAWYRAGEAQALPLAAFAASREVMGQLAPLGPVYQAGTLSGNPVATACGLTTLKLIQRPGFFESLSARTQQLMSGFTQAATQAGVPLITDCEGGMFGFFFADVLPQNYQQVMAKGSDLFNRFFHLMLDRGVYLAPAMYEAGFVSAAHTEQDIADTVAAAAEAFRQL